MTLEINAQFVETHEEEFTRNYSVVGIYFGEGDPENGGQHWNFTQSIGDEDSEDICVVKEIQQITFYGGIDEFEISRKGLKCVFNDSKIKLTGTKKLVINYNISDDKWNDILNMATRVFKGKSYFKISSEV